MTTFPSQAKQDCLNLKSTKKIISLYRNVPSIHLDDTQRGEYKMELFKLIETMAKSEWGENTTVDDFSIPGQFIIKSGRKEEAI